MQEIELKSLRSEVERLKKECDTAQDVDEVDQLRVQLAGCLTAADGATSDPASMKGE